MYIGGSRYRPEEVAAELLRGQVDEAKATCQSGSLDARVGLGGSKEAGLMMTLSSHSPCDGLPGPQKYLK